MWSQEPGKLLLDFRLARVERAEYGCDGHSRWDPFRFQLIAISPRVFIDLIRIRVGISERASLYEYLPFWCQVPRVS